MEQPTTPSKKIQVENRKLYQKPTIEQVRLVPEEAVLAACKVETGFISPNATAGCINVGNCLDIIS